MPTVQRCSRGFDLLYVRLHDRGDDVVLRFEVVVHVAQRHVCRLRDVRQGGAIDTLAIHELARGGYQPLPLARSRRRGDIVNRC
jgi:hypothetical protein